MKYIDIDIYLFSIKCGGKGYNIENSASINSILEYNSERLMKCLPEDLRMLIHYFEQQVGHFVWPSV